MTKTAHLKEGSQFESFSGPLISGLVLIECGDVPRGRFAGLERREMRDGCDLEESLAAQEPWRRLPLLSASPMGERGERESSNGTGLLHKSPGD